MPGGIQQSTVSGCQGLFQTQKKFLEKNVDEVKSEINSAFNYVADLLKNREAFLLNCIDDNVKTVSEFIARMEQQSSRHEFTAVDEVKLVRTPQLIFEADDLNTLQQMINNFGKAELSFDPKAVRPLTASDHPKLQPEMFDMEVWADENDDDFIVLTDGNETPIAQYEDTRSSDVAVMDECRSDVERLQRNPIADVIERVMLDSDEAWLSCDAVGTDCDASTEELENNAMPGWDHVEDSTFIYPAPTDPCSFDFKFTIPSTSYHYWLASDSKPIEPTSSYEPAGTSPEDVSENCGPAAGVISRRENLMDVAEPKTSLAHWLQSSTFEKRMTEGSSGCQQSNDQLFSSCEKLNAGSNFNSACRFTFVGNSVRIEELPGVRSSMNRDDLRAVGYDASFGNGGEKTMGQEPVGDDGGRDSIDAENIVRRLFGKIAGQPQDFWLVPNRGMAPRHSLPLSYWLSPASASASDESDCTHEFANLRVDEAADNFATFVQRVRADTSRDWLSENRSFFSMFASAVQVGS